MIRRAQPWLGTLVEISIAQPLEEVLPPSLPNLSEAADADAAVPGRVSIPAVPSATTVAIDAAFAAIALVHRRMSFHASGSDVSAINRLAVGASCAVDAHTAVVLRCALLLEEASDGLFNMACADALTAWGQLPAAIDGPAGAAFPQATVTTATTATGRLRGMAGIGRAVLTVGDDDRVTRLRPGAIDLGGIAKGYAVDLATAALQAAGVASAGVNAGGDLRTFGPAGMQVAIRDPARPTQAGRMLMLRDTALATSAGYFSRRRTEGVDSSALVDTLTCQPVLHGRSVSVLAPTCMLADGLTKPIIVSADPAHPLLARFGASALLL